MSPPVRIVRENSVSSALSIIHNPTGIDHPYEPLFEERRPRDPSAGDMVALGFLTRPGNFEGSVRVDWARNGKPRPPVFARAIQRNSSEDRWLVELGVVESGDVVSYIISAADSAGSPLAISERFEFTTREWRTAQCWTSASSLDGDQFIVATGRSGQAGITLRFASEPDSCDVRFEVVNPAARLHLRKDDQIEMIGGDGDELRLPRRAMPPLPIRLRWQVEGDSIVALELSGPLAPDESLCGFGERFDALNQHGRSPDIAVYEQYKNQGNRTYLPIPFFLSSKGYGLHIEGFARIEFDLGRTVSDRWRAVFATPSSKPAAFRWLPGDPAQVVKSFSAIAGRPEPLPLWAYGVWMSSNEWNTQARVKREVAETQRLEIPSTVAVIEAWSDETTFYIWNGAQRSARPSDVSPTAEEFVFPADGPWPDPQAMIDRLHAAGIHLILRQIPALKDVLESHDQHDRDVEHAIRHGYVVQNCDGSPYRNPFFWFNNAYIPDFTNQDAAAWWLSKRRYLLDEMGVDGFKTDGGEHLAGRGLCASNGLRGDELVNAYPDLYVGAYHRFATERRNGDGLTFSRAGHTHAGSFPAHWAGDENSTWDAFRRSIIAGLTAGLSGVTFWGWDIAGFSDALPSPELYLRAAAMATFCPIMQYHSEWNPPGQPSRDRTPWNIAGKTGDARAIDLFRHFANLRMNLLPYIAREARAALDSGMPLMRALFLDFPDDPTAWAIQDQYLFGRDLLVAPVVIEGATSRAVYLPEGAWFDFWTGDEHRGPTTIDVAMGLDRIPVFARGGSALPLRLGPKGELCEPTGNGVSLTNGLVVLCAGDAQRAEWLDDGQLLISSPVQRHAAGAASIAGQQSLKTAKVGALPIFSKSG